MGRVQKRATPATLMIRNTRLIRFEDAGGWALIGLKEIDMSPKARCLSPKKSICGGVDVSLWVVPKNALIKSVLHFPGETTPESHTVCRISCLVKSFWA